MDAATRPQCYVMRLSGSTSALMQHSGFSQHLEAGALAYRSVLVRKTINCQIDRFSGSYFGFSPTAQYIPPQIRSHPLAQVARGSVQRSGYVPGTPFP